MLTVTVIVEFTVPPDQFVLGGALPEFDVRIELERAVPTSRTVVPYLWVSGDGTEAFGDRVRGLPEVSSFRPLDEVSGQVLYRLELDELDPTTDVLRGTRGALLRAEWDGGWALRARFDERSAASEFMERCAGRDVPITVERVYTAARPSHEAGLDLTKKQREALELALSAGYFESPKRADLEELAAELEISPQALSKRLRRGNEQVLRGVLDGPARQPRPFVRGGRRSGQGIDAGGDLDAAGRIPGAEGPGPEDEDLAVVDEMDVARDSDGSEDSDEVDGTGERDETPAVDGPGDAAGTDQPAGTDDAKN